MLRNQRWSYTYFKLKLFQWLSFWGIIRALFVKTDLFKDANPLKKKTQKPQVGAIRFAQI